MLEPPDVVFVLLGDPTGSSRALRQIRALVGMGARVRVIGMGVPRDPDALPDGVTLVMLDLPSARGPMLFWQAHRALARALRGTEARVIHASDLHVLPAAAAAARRSGAALVYDAREWYAGLDASVGRAWVGPLWAAVESRWAPRADVVFTVNDTIADRIAETRGIARPVVVRNVAERSGRLPSGALRARLGLGDRPVALYQGLLRPGRGLAALVDAWGDVDGDLVLIGEGSEEDTLRVQSERTAPGRVHFVPFTPPDELATLTPDADLGVIVARPLTESLRLGLPNKLFEYAAAGLPVLAGSGIEPLTDIVRATGAGEAVDPDDRDALVAALRRMLSAPEAYRDGVARLRAAYTPERETAAFLDAYAPLLADRR